MKAFYTPKHTYEVLCLLCLRHPNLTGEELREEMASRGFLLTTFVCSSLKSHLNRTVKFLESIGYLKPNPPSLPKLPPAKDH